MGKIKIALVNLILVAVPIIYIYIPLPFYSDISVLFVYILFAPLIMNGFLYFHYKNDRSIVITCLILSYLILGLFGRFIFLEMISHLSFL